MNNYIQSTPHSTSPRRRAPRRAGNYYLRIAGIAAIGILGAVIVSAIVMKIVHPYQQNWAVDRDIQRIEKELNRQNEQNAGLEKQLAYLKTPDGAETEARRAGFARPGELVYLLHPVKK